MDLLNFEVFWHRLINAASEQFQALLQTAFSTIVRESADCAVGIFDAGGSLLAQPPRGTPGQINSMATSIVNFLDVHPADTLKPEDVLITNDPWRSAGHLNDITVVSPVFKRSRLVAFVGSCAHSLDIGGRGFSSDAQSIYEEGLYIPISKLFDQGRMNDVLVNVIKHNVRSSDLVVGDILAQTTCNAVGGEQVLKLMDEFALDDLHDVGKEICSRSERVARSGIEKVPDGRYEACVVSDGFEEPVEIRCAVVVQGDEVLIDYDSSSLQVPWGINVPLCYCASYTSYAIKALIAPDVPNNAGTFSPITVSAPEGSILNATKPAPVAARHLLGCFQPYAIYAALERAMPNQVIAGSSVLWITTIQGETESGPFTTTFFASGGMGARARKDGLSATGFPGKIAMTPIETLESVSPIIVHRKALRMDSGGAGRYRGGLGQDVEFSVRGDCDFIVNTMNDQLLEPPRGFAGARDGQLGSYFVDGDQPRHPKSRTRLRAGSRVTMKLPGGGGYGPPQERETTSILEDVSKGYVSLKAVREAYGIDAGALPGNGNGTADSDEEDLH